MNSNPLRTPIRRPAVLGISLAAFALAGCAAAPIESGYLAIAPNQYHEAFGAADEVARSYGLMPALRDRRAGIIETAPAVAGSLLEPWDRATTTLEQAVAGTVSFQRRRARFEFQPAGFDPAATDPDLDLTEVDALGHDFELRVWVYNERAHIPGIRRSHWSRRLTTRTEVIDPDTGQALGPVWTVVARDRALEERLLGEVSRLLDR